MIFSILIAFLFLLLKLIAGTILYEFIPNSQGVSNVDLYLKFSLTKTLPPDTVISIRADFLPFRFTDGDIKDYCWSSIDYATCTAFSRIIQIVTSTSISLGTPMSFYFDNAFDFTSATPGDSASGFVVATSWLNVIITNEDSNTNHVTIGESADHTVSNWWIFVDNPTIGDITDYGFNFTTTAPINPGDSILIKFDRTFNPWISEPKELDITDKNDANYYYVDCFSYTLGNIKCTAGHWYLNVTGITNTINSDALWDVWIKNIQNPDLNLVNAIMNIYIFNSDFQLKIYLANSSLRTIANRLPESSIYVKSVKLSNSFLWDSSDYIFEFYIDNNVVMSDDYTFYILFPQQYDFNANDTAIPCSASYAEDGNGLIIDPWISSQSCSFYNNYVTFKVPSGTSSFSFPLTTKFTIKLYGITNPRWGQINPWTSAWGDINFYGNTKYISDKFEIELFQEINSLVIARSYGLMHSGYVGLNKTTREFKFASPESCKIY